MSWLGAIRPTSANDAFDPALWATYLYNNSNNLFYEVGLHRGGAGHANCGRPGDELYDYDYEVVNCTEPSKVEALVTAAGLEWSEVDELSEEDVSTTRAASRGPCVAQTPSGRVWASGVGPWACNGDGQ